MDENEMDITGRGATPSPPVELDTTNLEKSIEELKEVIVTDLEQKAEEKAENELKAKEVEALNEEKLLEDAEADTAYKESVLQIQADQADNLTALIEEVQQTNEALLKQQELQAESSIYLILTIVITLSVKIFIDQVSKW